MSHFSTPPHKMKQNRIDSISIMRVLAMTMIVAFHSLLFYIGTWWHFGGLTVPIWVYLALYLTLENASKIQAKKRNQFGRYQCSLRALRRIILNLIGKLSSN